MTGSLGEPVFGYASALCQTEIRLDRREGVCGGVTDVGRGGYLGGGTILRIWPKLRKAKKKLLAVDASSYDFEARANEIRQDIEARKQMIAEGRNPLDFEGPSINQKRMIAKKARKKAAKKTKQV